MFIKLSAILLFRCLVAYCQPGRLWKTYYMDSSEITVRGESSCDRVRPVRNDDMAEGDYYAVKSDSWEGKPHITKRPSECTMTFNLGDRMVSLQVNVWWCLQPYPEPFLEVYSDCEGNRNGFLALFNCSSTVPTISVDNPSYCITLYHYRGNIKSGYFFSVSVVAMQELFSFPAGSIAAVIISGVVLIMIIVKVVCVVTGHDRPLSDACYQGEDQKKILAFEADVQQSLRQDLNQERTTQQSKANPEQTPHKFPATPSSILRYSRSPRSSYGNNFFPRTSNDLYPGDCLSDTDYDFLDASVTASPT